MAKVVKIDGRTFTQPPWQDNDKFWLSTINDNRRERRELNMLILQLRVDEIAKSL